MLHSAIAVINSRTTATRPGSASAGADADDVLRPLTPRSIVLSVLLGRHPPAMPVAQLLAFTSLFGIADGTTRTALSRLVAAGDLVVDDGRYRLADRLLARQQEQDTGRAGPSAAWDGTWWFVVVVAERRTVAERREFRTRAVGARLGELRPDVWIRPANVELAVELPGVVVTRGPLTAGDGPTLVGRLWDLEDLERRSRQLVAELDETIASLAAPAAVDRLPPAFTAMARAQRFLRAEPQLPAELSPHRSATMLRERYEAANAGFQDALRAFFTHRPAPTAASPRDRALSTGGR